MGRLIIATKNENKIREINELFKGSALRVVGLDGLRKNIRIIENGSTFQENASKKAVPVSRAYLSDYVIGEDSGFEVDYLKGAPGVRSKRYASKNGNQARNNKMILGKMRGVPFPERSCRFVCCLALAKAGKVLKIFDGFLNGVVSREERGSGGFGYDPIFYLPTYSKTVAELSLKQKNRISHRAKAFAKLEQYLQESA